MLRGLVSGPAFESVIREGQRTIRAAEIQRYFQS